MSSKNKAGVPKKGARKPAIVTKEVEAQMQAAVASGDKAETNGNVLELTDDDDDFNLIEPYELDIKPDFDTTGTVEELEKELAGFKFNGPGWYNYRNDTLLIVPQERELEKLWGQVHNDLETFRVFVFNGSQRFPQQDFGLIAQAPTRTY